MNKNINYSSSSTSSSSSESNEPEKEETRINKCLNYEYICKLSDLKYLTINLYQNKVVLQIRNFYEAHDGTLKPSKYGITLTAKEFDNIVSNIKSIKKKFKKSLKKCNIKK